MVIKFARLCCLILLFWPLLIRATDAERFTVEKVFDGDTILLADGRKVRLLGVNTPETDNRYKTAEAGGEQAKNWLRQRLEGHSVSLQTDADLLDKYGRTLAYVFTEDQQLVNLELVKNGLATVSIFPPNLKYTAQLLAAQQQAEQSALGLWAAPEYAPQTYRNLNAANYKGWKRITGSIQAIKQGGHSHFLQFSDQVSLQIENQYLPLFPPLENYLGKNLEARGWPYKSRYGYTLPIAHPGNIRLLE
ncbi:MAG: thermonuclease family protein [Methylococcales bacterium]|nr:thermonuclease family protein [Methylococcales bacterium]